MSSSLSRPSVESVTVASPASTASPSWDPLVLELFDFERRDRAIQALVTRGKFDHEPPYRERSVGPVKDVVLCPQRGHLPLVVVFLRTDYEDPGAPPQSGHFVVVRADGTLIPVKGGANSLTGYFGDLTADGVPELVTLDIVQFSAAKADRLRVRSLTEEFPDILEVLLSPQSFRFEIHQAPNELPSIQVQRAGANQVGAVAEYRWNLQGHAWEGPTGSAKQGFLRVTPENEDHAALSLAGKPNCRLLAESLANALPEVRRVLDDAGPDARPGGVDYSSAPDEVEFSIGFHHEERFESVFFVSVTDGELEVTGPTGPIALPAEVRAEFAAACSGGKKPSKQRAR